MGGAATPCPPCPLWQLQVGPLSMWPLSPQTREAGREAGGQQSRGRGQDHREARRGLLREPKGRVSHFTGGRPVSPPAILREGRVLPCSCQAHVQRPPRSPVLGPYGRSPSLLSSKLGLPCFPLHGEGEEPKMACLGFTAHQGNTTIGILALMCGVWGQRELGKPWDPGHASRNIQSLSLREGALVSL